MRLGLIARADNTGLGNQTYELYKWLKPAKTLIIDISSYNQRHNQHGYNNRFDRYNEGQTMISVNFPSEAMINQFLEGIDVLLTVESPYSYYLFKACRERGIKSIMQFNFEFLDYFVHPEWEKPDVLLAPSKWRYDEIIDKCKEWGCKPAYLPVPTNRQLLPFTQRRTAKSFIHIAGHNTYEDRNGTQIVFNCIKHVKSDVKFIIRSQYDLPQFNDDHRVNVIVEDVENYWELYNSEDALLLPRRYGGLSYS